MKKKTLVEGVVEVKRPTTAMKTKMERKMKNQNHWQRRTMKTMRNWRRILEKDLVVRMMEKRAIALHLRIQCLVKSSSL